MGVLRRNFRKFCSKAFKGFVTTSTKKSLAPPPSLPGDQPGPRLP